MRWSLAVVVVALVSCDGLEVDRGDQAVIGGRIVGANEFRNVVALLAGDRPLCTGTLIAPDVVLTAAHCVTPPIGERNPNVTFSNDARAIADPLIVSSVDSSAHPSFDISAPTGIGVGEFFDIGVVILAEPVTNVAPALLPTAQQAENNLVPGAEVDLVGYGLRVDQQGSQEFGEKAAGVATITTVGDNEVQISMPGEQQNCSGDSGGPAFLDVAGGARLVGVVSRSADGDIACDSGGIDTRVDAYLDFIDEATGGGVDGDGDGDGDGGGGNQGGGGSSTGGSRDGGCSVSTGSTGPLLWLVAVLLLVRRRRR